MRLRFNALQRAKITFLSLFYNHFLSPSYVFDVLMEPILWIVDHFTKALGPIFVIALILLNISVIFVAYRVGLPFYWKRSPPFAIFLVILGQYFKFNVMFYYYKAYTTPPGAPPLDFPPPNIASICKKCVYPKPPRTHHCSVCNVCVLEMDHHCPWLNSYVGHYNHRYFFLYMVFTVLGCIFIMIFGVELLYLQVFHESGSKTQFRLLSDRTLIFYACFMTVGTTLILGALIFWHGRLISKGETSIEAHINRSETLRLAKDGMKYVNPYDFGIWNNWCLFLGIIDGRGWSDVLFPSIYPPRGNGLTWDTVYSCGILWNEAPSDGKYFKL
uniref:Palmitoyltransferase n=1 Tax=Lepeophtheirus salmonis TaxID=72036 RepID=C1BT69_LEPSM|nr:Probable palmitoyltransferase ZDHHC16 [Lepeophtheirus salmonis]